MSPAHDGGPGVAPRLAGVALAGAMFSAMGSVALGFALAALDRSPGLTGAADAYRGWLAGGGWAWLPLWGAAAGLGWGARWAARRGRPGVMLAAALLAALPLAWKPEVPDLSPAAAPRTAAAKTAALRRWAFGGTGSVARIPALSRDADALIREQAVLSLGVNAVVSDLERGSPPAVSRFARSPLRDSLRRALEARLADPVEAVRAEAARALWKAPRAFGLHPAAAETLAAVLDRAPESDAHARSVWLALDAAAGTPHPALKAAAWRFALATPDSGLARAARRAAR